MTLPTAQNCKMLAVRRSVVVTLSEAGDTAPPHGLYLESVAYA